jgi:hypothetical protein
MDLESFSYIPKFQVLLILKSGLLNFLNFQVNKWQNKKIREDLEIGTRKSTLKVTRTKLDQDLELKIQKWNVYKQMASLVPWSCKL